MSRSRRLWQSLDRRTGLGTSIRRFAAYRVPADTGKPVSLGAVLVFALLLQLATGMLLLFHFVPDPSGAFESVRALMRDVPYGWLIRLAHAHGASFLVAIAFVHLFHAAFRGSYKDPREAVWWSGCVLFLAILASALTGYILPWSQTSFWATTVVTASLSYLPFVGQSATEWVRGGEWVGDATYRRAFAAHVALLPLALVAGVAVHLAWVRRVGLAGRPGRRADAEGPAPIPVWPRVALRAALACGVFAMALVASVVFAPNLFFPVEHALPADPFDTPLNVKPEWYFLWAYALPRFMPERLALIVQAGLLLALFALPLVDRSPRRHPRDRPYLTTVLIGVVLAFVALTIAGARA